MRGNSDRDDTYPLRVKAVPRNLPITQGGFCVFNVAKQEAVDAKVYATEAQATTHLFNIRDGK